MRKVPPRPRRRWSREADNWLADLVEHGPPSALIAVRPGTMPDNAASRARRFDIHGEFANWLIPTLAEPAPPRSLGQLAA